MGGETGLPGRRETGMDTTGTCGESSYSTPFTGRGEGLPCDEGGEGCGEDVAGGRSVGVCWWYWWGSIWAELCGE